jgi:hypothetical protein
MKNKRPFSAGINIGSVSIVMIFSVLALTVFAVLTLITSANEKKLAVKSAEAVKLYYAADCACEDKLAQVKELTAAEDGDLAKILASLPEGISGELKDGDLYIRCAEPVDGNRTLSVLAVVGNHGVNVWRWEIVDSGDWNPDESLNFQTP